LEVFVRKNIGEKAAHKMLLKLTKGWTTLIARLKLVYDCFLPSQKCWKEDPLQIRLREVDEGKVA